MWIQLSELSSLSASLYQVNHSSLYTSWETNLNIMIEVRIEANVDRLTDEHTDG